MAEKPLDVDVAIIGGGIAGCYAAYRLRRKRPSLKLAVLEAGEILGGRAQTDVFHGLTVPTGAGVGRYEKDHLLRRLMTSLGFPVAPFPTGHIFMPKREASGTCRVQADFETLVGIASDERTSCGMTFRDFARQVLPEGEYDRFIDCTGYADFENADADDVLFRYGFEDNYTQWSAFMVPWSDLISAMTRDVRCLLNTRVNSIQRTAGGSFLLLTSTGTGMATGMATATATGTTKTVLRARRVIIATNAASVRRLLPTHRNVYDHIHGQPFIRIYGAFTERSARVLGRVLPASGVTVLPGSPLQKVLHMRDNVYMIAYSDNANALALTRHSSNTSDSRAVLAALLEDALGLRRGTLHLQDTRSYFWRAGTHYYDPLSPIKPKAAFVAAAQHPMRGVFVVGECVALHQGWVEGALQSVENVL